MGIGYLMSHHKLSLKEAFLKLWQMRPIVDPNQVFFVFCFLFFVFCFFGRKIFENIFKKIVILFFSFLFLFYLFFVSLLFLFFIS